MTDEQRRLLQLRKELTGEDVSVEVIADGLDAVAKLIQELIGTLKTKELTVTVPDEVRVTNLGDITPDVEVKNEPTVKIKNTVKAEIQGTAKVEITKEPTREKVVPSVKETTAAIKSLEQLLNKIAKAGLSIKLDDEQRKHMIPLRVMPVDEKGNFMPASNNTTVFGRGGGSFSQQSRALLEEIATKLAEVVQNTADIELKAENVNLNTDTLESKISDLIVGMDPVAKYMPSDVDEGATSYFGYIDKDGNWYIQKVTATTHRYAAGSSDYATNWTGRAGLTYGYFNEVL